MVFIAQVFVHFVSLWKPFLTCLLLLAWHSVPTVWFTFPSYSNRTVPCCSAVRTDNSFLLSAAASRNWKEGRYTSAGGSATQSGTLCLVRNSVFVNRPYNLPQWRQFTLARVSLLVCLVRHNFASNHSHFDGLWCRTSGPETHWVAPALAGIAFGYSMMAIFMCFLAYFSRANKSQLKKYIKHVVVDDYEIVYAWPPSLDTFHFLDWIQYVTQGNNSQA